MTRPDNPPRVGYPLRCLTCSACPNCCVCGGAVERERGQRSQAELTNTRLWVAKATEHRRNPTTRLIGCEIEVATGDRDKVGHALQPWRGRIVSDGSLPSGGFEINTAPASGDLFMEQIDQICAAGSAGVPPVRVTPACGLHVHIDTRDLTYLELRRLVMLYAQLELGFFSLVWERRRASQYCKPCGPMLARALATAEPQSAAEAQQALDIAVYHQDYQAEVNARGPEIGVQRFLQRLREIKRSRHHSSRYTALNIHSHAYRGTVECRLFPGTAQAQKIQWWGMLWAQLVQHAHDMTDVQVKRIVAAATDAPSGVRVLQELAPIPEIRDWLGARYQLINGTPLSAAA